MVNKAIVRLPVASDSEVSSLCIAFSSDCSVLDLKAKISAAVQLEGGKGQQLVRLWDLGGRRLDNDDDAKLLALFQSQNHHHHESSSSISSGDEEEEAEEEEETLVFVRATLPLLGGKGGFGSMLRAQGGKMASQKTTNFESCRDLSGRRLKTIHDATKIADYIEKEPEIKRKKELEKQDKQEKILKKETTKKILYDDQVYLKTHEKTMDDMKDTMAKVLGKKKATAAPAPKNSKAVKLWGDEDSEDSDDDSKDEEAVGGAGGPSQPANKKQRKDS